MTRLAIVDIRIPEDQLRALMMRGFRVVALPPSPSLSAPIASHPDMLIARVGGEMVTSSAYCELAGAEISEIFDITKAKMHFTADEHGEKYPTDVIFNSLVMGGKLFARLDSLSPHLKTLAKEKGLRLVDTRQGYPACTVLKLSDEAAITADRGMAEVLAREGVRVYTIDDGGISLPPYEYGFIGGSGGAYNGTVYFLGDAAAHPSYDKIAAALEAEGLRAVMLGSGTLRDLGGIIFAEGRV